LAESEQKVRRVAETFLLRAIDTGRVALKDAKSAQALLPSFDESIDALR
jgi:hypothetical protein